MNFIKFGKSGPNLQQVQFENFELETSGLHGSWLRAQRTSQGNWFGGKTQSRKGSSFENLQELEQKAEIVFDEN